LKQTILSLMFAALMPLGGAIAQSQQQAPPPPIPPGVERANPTAQQPPEAARPVTPGAPAPARVPSIAPGRMPQPTHATAAPSNAALPTVVTPLPVVSGTPTTLTLGDALARALTVNNAVERSRAEIGVQQANQDYMFSQVMPRITTSGSLVRNSTEVEFGNGSDARTILPRNDWNYRVVLSQPIYAGNRERRAFEQAKLGVRNAEQQVRGTEDQVLLRVASNYLALVDAEGRIELERRNIELATKRREQATAFYQAGESTKVDVLRAETAIKASERMLALAQLNREQAASQLRVDLDLDTPIAAVRPEHGLPPVLDQTELEKRATESRPDITLAQNNLTIAQLEVRKQRGFWLPTLTFDGGLVEQKSTFPAGNYSYGALRFNIPLLQSGEVNARVAGAKQRELEAKLDLDSMKLNAREDVRKALVDLRSAETSLGLAREQFAAAEAEYNQSFELYRAQEATALDLSEAETSLADARRAVAEETLNRDLAELRVWYAAGAIKEAVAKTASNGVNQ
jgi:outer membrane protein TolC